MFDVSAYLARIGVTGRPSLAELHRAHVTSIPFENLDARIGVRVSLEIDALQEKLVSGRRGGYCFEHNTLFMEAVRAFGGQVEPMLGRVRWNRPSDAPLPLTHLLLRVLMEGQAWLADVGFGNGTLLEPIPFGPGGPYQQAGWNYRVIAEGDEHVLQLEEVDGWQDLYAFLPRPVEPIDVELSNWFSCTHPSSPFAHRLLIARQADDGTRTVLSDFRGELLLTVSTPTGSSETSVAAAALADILVDRFGLPERSVMAVA